MRTRIPAMLLLLLAGVEASRASTVLPLEIRQDLTTYNLQSQRGVPISTVVSNPPGSDGRMPMVNESYGSSNLPTTNQFRGLISFGAIPGLTLSNWVAVSNTASLKAGTNAFSGVVADLMKLPGAKSNNVVIIVLRRAQIGAPYFTRPISFPFGSIVSVPNTDINGVLLTNMVPSQYWQAEPYSVNNHLNAPYYWSPNARAVFAVQPGPIFITWKMAMAYTALTLPAYTNLNGSQSFITNGASIYALYTARYIVSGSAVKPPRKIYWTEGEYQALGKPVDVPTARVQDLKIVYTAAFPEFVSSNEVVIPPGLPYVPGLSDRTLWYDVSSRQIRANNLRGRAFLELLGDARADGSREHLGFEIVDVFREPTPADVTIELGEQITPPPPGSLAELSPEPINQGSFAYQHHIAGTERAAYYAAQRTENLNDYMIHWMENGLEGLNWPSLFARYHLVWPDAIDRYSLYLRPPAATEDEAKTTAIALATENVPVIQYQDPLDHPRAKLTEQFKFYTWLDTDHPAHRTLLRFGSGANIAFERVFSWLDLNLKSTNFVGSVAEELSAWNPTNRSFNWPEDVTAPRLVSATVDVGERITAPSGERGAARDEQYLAGYINLSAGTLYDPDAYVDPFTGGFDVANLGAIIPVNAIPGTNFLEVWWFRINNSNAGTNAGDTTKGFRSIYWPSAIGRYTLQWPTNAPEIVLASKLGSGTLDTFQAQGRIYVQNDPALPGYNPNEEHAIMAAGMAYATRDDLNITNATGGLAYSSHPFVLVEYVAEDGRPAITAFEVRREKPEAGFVFDYIVPAGQMLQPPMPLPLLGKPVDSTGNNFNTEPDDQSGDLPVAWSEARDASGPYGHYRSFTYRDRHDDFWVYRGPHAGLPVLQAGKYDPTNRTWGPLPSARAIVGQPFSLTVHASRQAEYLALTALSPLPAWLTTNGLTLSAIPGRPAAGDVSTNTISLVVEDTHEGSRFTNTLNLAVSTTGTVTGQTALVISCTNSFTGSIVNYSNRPPFLAFSPAPTNSFTMRYYYKTEPSFAWPAIASPPPAGSIVPYLRQFDRTSSVFVGGDGTSTESRALDIVYRPVWPERDPKSSGQLPTLYYGATLTKPAFGLPGVRDMRTAHVLYQESIAENITNASPSMVLHDPTRAKIAELPAELPELPSSVNTDAYQGNYYFPNLPPHLGHRVYFDPNRGDHGALVLKGEFVEELTGQSYLLLNVLRGTDLDAVLKLCADTDPAAAQWGTLVNSLATTVETFIENPAAPGSFIADPAQSASVAVQELAEVRNGETAVDSYALSATGPGSGYVTLLEAGGKAFTQPGDPVAMHIFKVGDSLEPGELKVIPAANPLSEQVTFQHTADMAGRFDEYIYEWRIAPPVDGAAPPVDTNMTAYSGLALGSNLPCYTLGGAGIQALSDNYVVMRYSPNNPSHPLYQKWSQWTRPPKLAEGWIKRVLAGINPFNQRVTDLFNNRVNTDVSILTQAGHRWEGDIALNLDTIDNYGLIEIYETILRRGRSLSIESGYNYGPANDALLLAAGYLNDLYMMEGNEAWADAANPTIGIGTKDSTYGDIATALFAFKGQVPSVLEEELALLRGRDDFMQPGVEVAPIYNRLFWNYTRGIDAGEVIYAINYNVQENPDAQPDGVIDAEDAAYMYPQGHGDAYGHYLTALKGYYSLLLNSYFDWVPRMEAVNVLGQPVSVDYLDERKFAAAAAAVARAGRQIFDLTWRKDYQATRNAGWEHFGATRQNTQRTVPTTRYWGLDHWACRSGQGAYLNWVVGNAILPEVDPNPAHEGIQKIDRTTVPELQELTTLAKGLQTALDNAEGGLSPLGLPEDALAFDLNPSAVVGTDGGTHFEQIYERAKVALNNALTAFDDAKDVTRLMRSEQDSLAEFQASVAKQELAYNNALIEIYGSPYPDDVGPGKTYRQEYTGPDLLHYMYVNQPELNFPSVWNYETNLTFPIDLQNVPEDWLQNHYTDFDFIVTRQDGGYDLTAPVITYVLNPHGYFEKPTDWTGQRASPGKLQQAISEVILAHGALRQALFNSSGGKDDLDKAIAEFRAEVASHDEIRDIQRQLLKAEQSLASAKFAGDLYDKSLELADAISGQSSDALKEALPKVLIVGLSNGGDVTSAARGALDAAKTAKMSIFKGIQYAAAFILKAFEFSNETAKRWTDFDELQPLAWEQSLRDKVMGLSAKLFELQGNLWTINQRLRQLDDAEAKVRALMAEGDRLQAERQTYRQRASAVVQGYRTRDAAFRIFRNEKLERYKTLFDLSARYSLLAANAYDYETGLLNSSAGRSFIQRIIQAQALGVVRNGEPQYAGSNTGDPGLSSALAEMKADWDVLRGRLGFNNPDAYGTTVSLRTECLRILPSSDGDDNWTDALHLARKDNLLDDQDVRRFCMQINAGDGLPVPGLVLTFSTTIADGYNLFGRDLAAGDHAFSPSSFATKIFAVGVALEGYRGMDDPDANTSAGGTSPPDPDLWYLDPLALAATPYVYLIPVGLDSMRSPPLGDVSAIRSWSVNDVAIPMPFNIGDSDFSSSQLWQSEDSLTEPLFALRKHQAFRPVSTASLFSTDLYGPTGTLVRSQYTNNRMVGRSVWNSQWKLVIPGKTLLADPNEGLDRFLKTVSDIKLHFVTYSYSGN